MKRTEWLLIKEVLKGIEEDELANGSGDIADKIMMLAVAIEPVFSITSAKTVGEEIAQQYTSLDLEAKAQLKAKKRVEFAYMKGAVDLLMSMKEAIGLEDDGWHDSLDDCWAGDIARKVRTPQEVGEDIGRCIRDNYLFPNQDPESEVEEDIK